MLPSSLTPHSDCSNFMSQTDSLPTIHAAFINSSYHLEKSWQTSYVDVKMADTGSSASIPPTPVCHYSHRKTEMPEYSNKIIFAKAVRDLNLDQRPYCAHHRHREWGPYAIDTNLSAHLSLKTSPLAFVYLFCCGCLSLRKHPSLWESSRPLHVRTTPPIS